VTSATSAFKENMDFDDEDDEENVTNNHTRHHTHKEPTNTTVNNDDVQTVIDKSQPYSNSSLNKSKNTTKLPVQDNNITNQQPTGVGQQDEWEEFEDPNAKYDQLRLKLSRGNNNDDDDDEDDYYDDGNHPINHDTNIGDDENHIGGGGGNENDRTNRRREQQKDKPVWKLDQVKQTESVVTSTEKVEEPPQAAPVAAPSRSGAYRPPQLRSGTSVTVVSGVTQRPSKKEKPNLASNEDFPTLGAAVNKK
jgi:hypothetical protein